MPIVAVVASSDGNVGRLGGGVVTVHSRQDAQIAVVRGGSQQQCAACEGGDLRGRRWTARGGTVDERSRRRERDCCRP
eukprot:scaffold69355_cov24-Cyclotella_meneghiniana.AAC.1